MDRRGILKALLTIALVPKSVFLPKSTPIHYPEGAFTIEGWVYLHEDYSVTMSDNNVTIPGALETLPIDDVE